MPFPDHASPALIRAFALVIPGVTELAECPEETITERNARRIRLAVARDIFGRGFRSWAEVEKFIDKTRVHDAWDNASRLTEATIVLDGIGSYSFYLNEYLGDDQKLSDFVSVRDYDEADHHRQEAFHAEEGGRTGGPRPYTGRLLWNWARWYDCGLVYGNLSMARNYLHGELEDFVFGMLDERFQTEFIEGPDHGKKSGDNGEFTRWDMVQVPPSDALCKSTVQILVAQRITKIVEGALGDRLEASEWIKRTRNEYNGERNETILFSNVAMLTAVRIRNWVADLGAAADGAEIYDAVFEEAKGLITAFMARAIDAVVSLHTSEDGGALEREQLVEQAQRLVLELED